MSTSDEHLTEEPQQARGAPGSRDTGSDAPSGGPTDRPSGTYQGDETVPSYGQGTPEHTGGEKTEAPPSDTEPAVPPYEGRQTEAKPDTGLDEGGDARTGGAVKPVTEN
jgi:hypothetical protein